MTQKFLNQSGFSLVETLVAVTILLLVIVGPMTLSLSTAKSTSFASEQAVAFFLAQEGAELAQMGRDEIVLDGFSGTDPNPWQTFSDPSGFFEPCFRATGCGLEQNTDAAGSLKVPVDCAISATTCLLKRTTSNVRSHYTYSTAGNPQSTLFTRVIRFENTTGDQVRVRSEVTWRTGSLRATQRVEVETYLFDIYGS